MRLSRVLMFHLKIQKRITIFLSSIPHIASVIKGLTYDKVEIMERESLSGVYVSKKVWVFLGV